MNMKKTIASAFIILALAGIFSYQILACGEDGQPACDDYSARFEKGDTAGMTSQQWAQALNNPSIQMTPELQKSVPADQVNNIPADKMLVKDLTAGQYQKLDSDTISQVMTKDGFEPGAANQQELSKAVSQTYGANGLNMDVTDMNTKTQFMSDGIIFTNNNGVRTTIKQADLSRYSEIKTLPDGELQMVLKEGETGTFYNDHGNDIRFQGKVIMKEDENYDLHIKTGEAGHGKVLITTNQGSGEVSGDSTLHKTSRGGYDVTLEKGSSIKFSIPDTTRSYDIKNTGNNPLTIGIDTTGNDITISSHKGLEYTPNPANQFEFDDGRGTWKVDGMTRKLSGAGLEKKNVLAENQENGDKIIFASNEEGSTTGSYCPGGSSNGVAAAAVVDVTGDAVSGGYCVNWVNCNDMSQFTEGGIKGPDNTLAGTFKMGDSDIQMTQVFNKKEDITRQIEERGTSILSQLVGERAKRIDDSVAGNENNVVYTPLKNEEGRDIPGFEVVKKGNDVFGIVYSVIQTQSNLIDKKEVTKYTFVKTSDPDGFAKRNIYLYQ